MQTTQLFEKFYHGISWNAFFYIAYKILVTSLSFFLYYFLSTNDFAIWANINSTMFLLLLWIDFGLRKSIPRYAPEFAKNKQAEHKFISYIVYFQILVLILALPLYIYLGNKVIARYLINRNVLYIWCIAGALFIAEGIIGLMRLIFHSHFWNKPFNLLMTITIIIEMLINIFFILTFKTSNQILHAVLITKLMGGVVVIIVSSFMIKKLYKDTNYPGNKHINIHQATKGFIKHSAIMWINNNLKSLSERNFLVPFFTYTLGAGAANLFKVANDGALLFYRIIIKTIGTTDTSLLSHIEASQQQKKLMPIAFKKLTTKVAGLCLPLLGIIGFIYLQGNGLLYNTFVFQSFIIMVVGYLVELIFLSYERLLEIKRNYILLMIAYTPYIVVTAILILGYVVPYLGLLYTILLIHGVRLVSLFIIVYFARHYYQVMLPIKFIFSRVCVYTLLIYSLYVFIIMYVPVCTQYISVLLTYIIKLSPPA